MRQFGSRARSVFDRVFPERQIYHRSCGSVRHLLLSPGRQVLLALSALVIAGWFVYATTNTLLEGQQHAAGVAALNREHAKYQRWLNESRAQTVTAHAQLEQNARLLDRTIQHLEDRHEILRVLLEYAGGSGLRPARRLDRDGARTITGSLIDEIEPTRSIASQPYRVTNVSAQALEHGETLPLESSGGVPHRTRVSTPSTGANMPALASQDFVAYLRDPVFAERVARIAARVTSPDPMRQWR
jgi:hypothetical protein